MLGTFAKYLIIIVKNVRRNMLRSTLTAMGTMMLVLVVTAVWSVLSFIDEQTREKANDFKVLVTEKNKAPSRLPYSYVNSLKEGAARKPDDVRPTDYMTWAFYGGTLDKAKMTRENFIFLIAGEAEKVPTMMDELDQLGPADKALLDSAIAKMKNQRNACIIGPQQLKTMGKKSASGSRSRGSSSRGSTSNSKSSTHFPRQLSGMPRPR